MLDTPAEFKQHHHVKAVDLLIKSELPEDIREFLTDMDDKSINNVLVELYKRHPDKYREISHRIATIGREASYRQGETISLKDLLPVVDRGSILNQMDKEVAMLLKEFKGDPDTFKKKREEVWLKYSGLLEKATTAGARTSFNNIGMSVFSGARGKPAQIQAMLTTPALYQDQDDKTIPLFIRHSFSEGLRPGEYMAGTYGARKSVISTKVATAKGGDLAKLMSQANANLVITEKDCKVDNGIAYDVDDPVTRNRILQKQAGSLPAGTLLDRHAQAQLRKEKVKRVVARSPLTCKADGLCAQCVGMTFDNRFPKMGEHVGITAANALCLHGSTKVMMSDYSWKKLRLIKKGDKVLGFNENGTFTPTPVLDVVHQGKQPVFEFRFKSRTGSVSILSTPNHVFLASGYNNKTSKKLERVNREVGSLKAKRQQGENWGLERAFGYAEPENPVDEKYAFILGLLLGDGNIGPSSIKLSCYDPSLTQEVKDYLEELGIKLNGTDRTDKGDFIISTYPEENPLRKRLEELGLWGSRTRNKFIPEEVIQTWSHDSVCKLLAGLYASDGYIGAKQEVIKFTSASEGLAEGVAEILRGRFMLPGVYLTPFQRHTSWEYDVRVRNRTGMHRLASYLEPHMLGKKKHALRQTIKAHQEFDRDIVYMNKCKPVGLRNTYDLVLGNKTHMFVTEGLLLTHNSEPITQGALGAKHTAGQAKGKKQYGGFDILSQFVQSPEEYQHRAMVAPEDGIVTEVSEAPQGGTIVKVNDQEIYVPAGYPVTVKQGDNVEDGDQLSEGIVDVRDIVNRKGLGAGRKYYTERLQEIYADSGMNAHKKNLEILARGALASVNIDDEMDDMDYLPDDAANYSEVARKWKPKNVTELNVAHNPAGWLTKDTLHHTAGTRVTRSLLKELSKEGIETVPITNDKPPFSPRMDRLRVASHANRDWLASMSTSYLKDQLNDAAVRGMETNVKENQHWAPRIAVGEGFGQDIERTGKF